MNNKKTQVPWQRRQKFDACRKPYQIYYFSFLYHQLIFNKMASKDRTHEELWTIYYSEQVKRISEKGDFDWDKQERENTFNKERSEFKSG